ncbi:MAG TPA: zinc ribbon domain-containing protein [Candidatus Nitrosopolaris sp.]|nr:zinc ribbon domain-containing protein [Candidatus Nitrosopolaris sp.]
MKVFNARAATEEYMSTHSLTFSTPEMTLKKFAMWLGEQVEVPGGKEGDMPRLMIYLEEKLRKNKGSFLESMPDIDETFKPTGAVTKLYDFTEGTPSPKPIPSGTDDSNTKNDKFCEACGSKIKLNSRYCKRCGERQE